MYQSILKGKWVKYKSDRLSSPSKSCLWKSKWETHNCDTKKNECFEKFIFIKQNFFCFSTFSIANLDFRIFLKNSSNLTVGRDFKEVKKYSVQQKQVLFKKKLWNFNDLQFYFSYFFTWYDPSKYPICFSLPMDKRSSLIYQLLSMFKILLMRFLVMFFVTRTINK